MRVTPACTPPYPVQTPAAKRLRFGPLADRHGHAVAAVHRRVRVVVDRTESSPCTQRPHSRAPQRDGGRPHRPWRNPAHLGARPNFPQTPRCYGDLGARPYEVATGIGRPRYVGVWGGLVASGKPAVPPVADYATDHNNAFLGWLASGKVGAMPLTDLSATQNGIAWMKNGASKPNETTEWLL